MEKVVQSKKTSGILSLVCGVITALLGIIICFLSEYQTVAFILLFFNIVLNLILHIESYVSNKKVNKPQASVLTIGIVEMIFTVVL